MDMRRLVGGNVRRIRAAWRRRGLRRSQASVSNTLAGLRAVIHFVICKLLSKCIPVVLVSLHTLKSSL